MALAKTQLTTFVCDRCGRYGAKNTEGPFFKGGFHIRATGAWLHRRGAATGPPAVTFDLCRRCTNGFMAWLKSPNPVRKESI